MRVWIAQCLCPSRHAILGASGEAESEQVAIDTIRWPLQEAVEKMVLRGEINPRCGLCHAPSSDWHYEVGRTRFRTMAEAIPELQRLELEQAATRAVFGDLLRSD